MMPYNASNVDVRLPGLTAGSGTARLMPWLRRLRGSHPVNGPHYLSVTDAPPLSRLRRGDPYSTTLPRLRPPP